MKNPIPKEQISQEFLAPRDVVKWLNTIKDDLPKCAQIFYHADADGCVSAAFWTKLISSLGFTYTVKKISTSQLGFEHATSILKKEDPELAIFLDLPAGTQFAKWWGQLSDKLLVFVYDHHRVAMELVNYPPRFFQYGIEKLNELPPTCVFSHDVYKAFNNSSPNWLTTLGLIGEGQRQRFPEYTVKWKFANQTAKLITYGVLRSDEAALEYLLHYLDLNTIPPDPITDPKARILRKTSEVVGREIQNIVRSINEKSTNNLIVAIIDAKHEIPNYVASEIKRNRANSIVVIGQIVGKDLIRAELRTGENRSEDLRILIEKIRSEGLLLGGGGHPNAVGARLWKNKWDSFVNSIRKYLNE